MKKKFKSDAFEAIHESALALHSVGAIDKATMREFDEDCTVKTPIYKPTKIKKIREEGLTERIVSSKVGGGN
jgi:putative transcriptional regulator